MRGVRVLGRPQSLAARDLPEAAGAVEDLELVLVTDALQFAGQGRTGIRVAQGFSWGAKYVVGPAHGWLGAVGFASSTHRLGTKRGRDITHETGAGGVERIP